MGRTAPGIRWKPVGALLCLIAVSPQLSQSAQNDEAFVIRMSPSSPKPGDDPKTKITGEKSDADPSCTSGQRPPPWPRFAPRSPSDWLSAGWCEESVPCPDTLISSFVSQHNTERRLAGISSVEERKFLACKPMGGIGNWISGLMSCFAVALMTNRSLLLAAPPPTPPEKTTSYDEPVESLFDFPIDLSLSVLGSDVKDVPFLVEGGSPKDTAVLQMLDLRVYDFLCSNMSSSIRLPVAVMPAHLWLGALPQNIHHSNLFTEHFSRDNFGTVPFFAKTGSWLLRPKPHILAMVEALARTLSGFDFIYGIQARVGMDLDVKNYNDRPPAGSGPEFVRCAYAYAPPIRRNKPSGWIVTGDQAGTKADILMQIARTEGPITAAANEDMLREMGVASQFFAADGSLGVGPGRIDAVSLDADLLELGFAVIIYASGSRAVVLAKAPPMATRSGMLAAVIEMWFLSYAILIVVTENSTFWIPAVSFAGSRSAVGGGEYVLTRGKRCYPLPTTEPPSDAGFRSRRMTGSRCHEDSLMDPSMLWLPPE